METSSTEDRLDGWLRLYEGQIEHVRHHENMRAQATNVIIAISAAMVAFLASGDTPTNRPHALIFVGTFVVVVNLYGLLMSLKHYERARLSAEKASGYREVVSELISTATHNVESIRQSVEAEHDKHSHMLLTKVRAHYLWSGLHLVIAIIGAAIFVNGLCS